MEYKNAVSAVLSEKFKTVEFFYIADWHIGCSQFNEKAAKRLVDYIAEKPNRFCAIGGDMLDNATVGSVSDGFKATMCPEDQLQLLVELLEPIKDRILAVVEGNHEKRTSRTTSINLMKAACGILGIEDKYTGDAFLLFLSFGHGPVGIGSYRYGRVMFVIYGKHGSGGGGTVGGKLNKVAKMADTVDCDVYLHAHTHMPGAFKKNIVRVNRAKRQARTFTQLFVNTCSLLNFGGYGERLGFAPSCQDVPMLIFSANPKEVKAVV